MDRFAVTLRLASPLVTGGGYMTLDELLAAVPFDSGETGEAAHAVFPLENTQGVGHGLSLSTKLLMWGAKPSSQASALRTILTLNVPERIGAGGNRN